MNPTPEEIKQIAIEEGFFKGSARTTDGELCSYATDAQIIAFAKRIAQMQRESDAKICKRLGAEPTDTESDYADGFDAGCRECEDAIRNNTGEP